MHFKCVQSGIYGANCYIVSTDDGSFMIDPGGMDVVPHIPADLKAIVLTHGHFDHIGGVDAVLAVKKVPIYIHEKDAHMLTDTVQNLSAALGGYRFTATPADQRLHDGDEFMGFRIMHTPGHSFGSICLYSESDKILFSGDTLFRESYGRYDFGDLKQLLSSLNKLLLLPADTAVYPGHEMPTTIGHELTYNPAAGYR